MMTSQTIPKDLREQMLERLATASEEDLVLVHEILLHAEKDRLWHEIQADAEAEQKAGKWDRLPEIIREVRARLRQS